MLLWLSASVGVVRLRTERRYCSGFQNGHGGICQYLGRLQARWRFPILAASSEAIVGGKSEGGFGVGLAEIDAERQRARIS